MEITPEDIERERQRVESQRRLQEERDAEAERIQNNANANVERSSTERLTPAQASQQAEVKGPNRPEGGITELGERLQDGLNAPQNLMGQATDALNELVPDDSPLKPVTEFLADRVMGADEWNERMAESSAVGRGIVGATSGTQAGLLTPVTVAGRVTNQATPWSEPPEVIRDSAVGNAAFNIAEVAVPSLVIGLATGGMSTPFVGGATGLVAESALETAVQTETNRDVIAGRTVARSFGEIADALGYDGGALTQELIESETPKSIAFNAVMGFLQNMGINFGVNQLVRALRPGKSVDEIVDEVLDGPKSDIIEPNYKPDAEPHEVLTTDTVSPTAPPSAGRTYINDEVLTPDYVRNIEASSPYFTDANRRVFASLDRVSTREGMESVLAETAERLKGFNNSAADEAAAKARTVAWWNDNADIIKSGEYDQGAFSFASDRDLIKTQRGKEGLKELVQPDVDSFLREYAETTPEGALASALVGDVMGSKGIKLATLANNLDTNGIDFTNVVNEFARLTDRFGLFSIPERRGARGDFYLGGTLRQRSRLIQARDQAGIKPSGKGKNVPTQDAPGREYELIRRNEDDAGSTFSELWVRAQDGDTEALQTVKEYMRLVSTLPPEKALGGMVMMDGVIKNAVKKGSGEATTQLMYAARITSISTQAVSAGSTFARFFAEPLGNVMSPLLAGGSKADFMYGIGALKGSFAAIGDGMRIARQTFSSELPVNSGSKFEDGLRHSAQRAAEMDTAIQAFRQQVAKEGQTGSMEHIVAELTYNYRRWANSPLNRLGARLLTSADDGFKVALGSQIASGRAYRLAAQQGQLKDLDSFIKVEFDKVFREGVQTGRITDDEVLQAGRNLTFQDSIPKNGNFVDRIFESAQFTANQSAFGRYFLPFVKASYTSLELVARYEPSGALRALVPKYKRILSEVNPETGLPTARAQQLQGQIAFSRFWTGFSAMSAFMGMSTGYNHPDPSQRTKIYLPVPGRKDPLAIDYSRLEPFSSILAVTSDMVNSLKSGALSEQDYNRFAEELVFSIASASTDKTFMRGLLNMGALLNYKEADWRFTNTVKDSVIDIMTLPLGGLGGLGRQTGRIVAPSQSISDDPTNPLMDFLNGLKGRVVGGIGDPPRHSLMGGEPIRFVPESGNPLVNAGASLINQSLPINVQDGEGEYKDVIKELNLIGFDLNEIKTDEYKGVSLSPQQQSDFQREIGQNLPTALRQYFSSSKYRTLRERMRGSRRIQGNANDGSAAGSLRQQIKSDIQSYVTRVKNDAASQTILTDPEYQQRANPRVDNFGQQQQWKPTVTNLLDMKNK